MNIRPELEEFALAMEQILRKHDDSKRNSWVDPSFTIWECLERVEDELGEYYASNNPDELLDAANFIFFAWYKRRISQ